MAHEVEANPNPFRQDPDRPTHYCAACGKQYGFPDCVPRKSNCCSQKLWPLEGDEFAISREQMLAGVPSSE